MRPPGVRDPCIVLLAALPCEPRGTWVAVQERRINTVPLHHSGLGVTNGFFIADVILTHWPAEI